MGRTAEIKGAEEGEPQGGRRSRCRSSKEKKVGERREKKAQQGMSGGCGATVGGVGRWFWGGLVIVH